MVFLWLCTSLELPVHGLSSGLLSFFSLLDLHRLFVSSIRPTLTCSQSSTDLLRGDGIHNSLRGLQEAVPKPNSRYVDINRTAFIGTRQKPRQSSQARRYRELFQGQDLGRDCHNPARDSIFHSRPNTTLLRLSNTVPVWPSHIIPPKGRDMPAVGGSSRETLRLQSTLACQQETWGGNHEKLHQGRSTSVSPLDTCCTPDSAM